MLSRKAKSTFYLAMSPLMRLNAFRYRHISSRRANPLRVHLGPGQQRYIDGWVNVDANMFTGKCDIWADLRYPLPFRDSTIDVLYSHHMIEHLPDTMAHIKDIFRCLKPGAVVRIGGPNGDSAIFKFIENDHQWFSDYPDKRKSIGGRFENFIFCKGEHLTILTFSYLEELLSEVGFIDIEKCLPMKQTNYPEDFSICLTKEHESDPKVPHTLIVEARKPI